jgi:hypothetical protein
LLSHTGLIKPASRPFAQPELVHEARMKPYVTVTDPPMPTLEEFTKSQTITGSVTEALAKIEARIPSIKAHLANLKKFSPPVGKFVGTEGEWKATNKKLETTSVAIFVGASVVKRAVGTDEGVESLQSKLEVVIPEPGKRYHDWWVVPQIKPKK